MKKENGKALMVAKMEKPCTAAILFIRMRSKIVSKPSFKGDWQIYFEIVDF